MWSLRLQLNGFKKISSSHFQLGLHLRCRHRKHLLQLQSQELRVGPHFALSHQQTFYRQSKKKHFTGKAKKKHTKKVEVTADWKYRGKKSTNISRLILDVEPMFCELYKKISMVDVKEKQTVVSLHPKWIVSLGKEANKLKWQKLLADSLFFVFARFYRLLFISYKLVSSFLSIHGAATYSLSAQNSINNKNNIWKTVWIRSKRASLAIYYGAMFGCSLVVFSAGTM